MGAHQAPNLMPVRLIADIALATLDGTVYLVTRGKSEPAEEAAAIAEWSLIASLWYCQAQPGAFATPVGGPRSGHAPDAPVSAFRPVNDQG
jgi:hypothetical protein